MRAARIDLYGVLGVARSASPAELRRAYRRLALLHHPDRAGAASAPRFAGIADAYRLLSNPVARAAYDASLAEDQAWRARDGGAVHAGGVGWTVEAGVGTNNWRTARPRPIPDLLARVSGKLPALIAAGVARMGAGGAIHLELTAAEATAGGTAAVQTSLTVACASCGGVARPRGVWCRTCEYEGKVTEEVTVCVRVPPGVRAGARFSVPVSRAVHPPLWFQIDSVG